MTVTTIRLAYAEAYAIKDSGYRGVAKNMLTNEIARGEVRSGLAQAREDAKRFVWAWADGRNMATGSYRHSHARWRMNYFVRSDEAEG
jgi:hypothetical protein